MAGMLFGYHHLHAGPIGQLRSAPIKRVAHCSTTRLSVGQATGSRVAPSVFDSYRRCHLLNHVKPCKAGRDRSSGGRDS
jgi:hypothetical protein